MDEFRWFKIALLLFAAGLDLTSGQESSRIYIRNGDEALLPCKHVKDDQKNCDKIDWIFTDSGNQGAVGLIEGGQIVVNAREKSIRLSVSKNCSLVIKKVSAEDGGQYNCRQGYNDAQVHLFLVTMTEQENDEMVTLSCSVRPCKVEHSLKWLPEDKVAEDKKDEDNKRKATPSCSASVTFNSSYAQRKPKYLEAFQCKMADLRTKQVHYFTFQSSDEEATTEVTTTATTPLTRTTESSNKITTNSTRLTIKDWWLYVIVARDLLALVIIIAVIIRWKRTKGKKTEKDENTAELEDGDSYTNIGYIKKTRKARVKNDEG